MRAVGAAWLTGRPVAMPGEATTNPNAVSELAKARASEIELCALTGLL